MAHTKTLSLSGLDREVPRIEEDEAHAIRQQLERILTHSAFRNSKRYPALLRYVVEHALDGEVEQLKERTLGIEVFGRESGYDTNADHIVRTTAGEIRKRIAQYYHEPGHDFEIRIDLPSGSYVPEFHWPPPRLALQKQPEFAAQAKRRLWPYLAGLIVLAIFLLGAAWVRSRTPESTLDQFWTPVLASPNPVLLCLGIAPVLQSNPPVDSNNVTVGASHRSTARTVGLSDAITLARITSLMGARGKSFQIRSELSSTLDDLRNGPVILIGGFNNDWTMRLTQGMRFTFERDPNTAAFRIKDKQNPAADWTVNMDMPLNRETADYALVSRVHDSTTGRIIVVAAGIGAIGTMAAGEFLTDPQYMAQLARQAPKDWEHKNVQVVITAQVINAHAGPPRVVATQFW